MSALDWQRDARCRDMDPSIFFGDGPAMTADDIDYAKGVCAGCPVKEQCLDFAVETIQEYGIWAATTYHDREKIRRQRRLGTTARADRTLQRSTEARRLLDMGNTADQIAQQMGVDRRTVQRLTNQRFPVSA